MLFYLFPGQHFEHFHFTTSTHNNSQNIICFVSCFTLHSGGVFLQLLSSTEQLVTTITYCTPMSTPQSQIAAQLQSAKSLSVSHSWLDTFIASSSASLQRNIPISALTQTALFRVLSSDFRDTLITTNPSSVLPMDIFDPAVKERRLVGPIPVQVLDIEDIGSSLWSQVEAIERVERGEAIRGREIVRTVSVGEEIEDRASNNNNSGNNNAGGNEGGGNGPHRLILQDAAGTRTVGIELRRISDISIGKLPIGAKLILRSATVARGMVLLTPDCATVLGGKIESMDRAWKEGRKARLMARINEMAQEGQMTRGRGGDAMEE